MKEQLPEVTAEHITVNDNDLLIFTVKNGLGRIGVCRIGGEHEDDYCLYSHDVPVLLLSGMNRSPYFDMTVTERGSVSASSSIGKSIDEAFNQLCSGTAPEYALPQILRLFSDGLYAVSFCKAYPTYGDSMFFWSSYGMPKLLRGSGRYVNPIPENKNYAAPFILPLISPSGFEYSGVGNASRGARYGDKLFGISLHISGMYSALLKGHYAACAAVVDDEPFYTMQIQPVSDLWREPDEEGKMHTLGFCSASFKIPFSALGREQLRTVLQSRKYLLPDTYDVIKAKLGVVKKKNNYTIPKNFSEFAESYPNAEMVASAQGIDELTKPMLDALLSGSTTLDDKVIISDNYYSSITAACDYLRYHSNDSFIDFALDIMKNPDLSATYSYVAGCMAKITDKRVKAFFESVLSSEEADYSAICAVAKNYVDNYGKHENISRSDYVKSFAAQEKSSDNIVSLTRPYEKLKDSSGADLVAKHISSMMKQ